VSPAAGAVPSGGESLADFVSTAQLALGSQALAIVSFSGGELEIVGREGLDDAQSERLCSALASLWEALGSPSPLHLPFLAESDLAGARELVGQGYTVAAAEPAELEHRLLGAIVALRRDAAPLENLELMHVFARQAAMALAQRRRRDSFLLEDRLGTVPVLDQLVLSTSTLPELRSALDKVVGPLFGTRSTGIMVWDQQRDVLRLVAGSFGADESITDSCQIRISDPRSIAARVFTSGRARYSNQAKRDAALRGDWIELFGIERVLTAPLIAADGPVGVLHLADRAEPFTREDLERAQAMAPKIAAVVGLASTLVRLRQQRTVEQVLSNVAVAVASGETLQAFLPSALGKLCTATEASLLAFVHEDGDPIVERHGPSREPLERMVLDEAAGAPGIRAYVVGSTGPGDPGAAVFHHPVRLGAQRVGTLAALRARSEPFSQDERRALVRVASLTALARATERYQQQRAELARLHERQRIAGDLHDDVAQLLFAAQLNLDAALERDSLDPKLAEALSKARGYLIRGDTAIRTVINRLSSAPSADLGSRLASAVASIEEQYARAIRLELADDAVALAKTLQRATSDALLEAARESVIDAINTASPGRVTVRLETSRRGRLIVSVVNDDAAAVGGQVGSRLARLRPHLAEQGVTVRARRGPAGGTHITASVSV
jgi:signal transduction histidine kinase